MQTATYEDIMNTGASRTQREEKDNIRRSLGGIIGSGACKAMAKVVDRSDAFKTYYQTVDHPSMLEYVGNLANTVGRGGAKTLAYAVKGIGAVRSSETYGMIKERISKGYTIMRDGMRNYLDNSKESIRERALSDLENNNGKIRTSTMFMGFAHAMGSAVNRAYSIGEKMAGTGYHAITDIASDLKNEIKQTDGYKTFASKISDKSVITNPDKNEGKDTNEKTAFDAMKNMQAHMDESQPIQQAAGPEFG